MSVLKKYKGKRITAKDKNWTKGTWYVWKRIPGQKKPLHKALTGIHTKEDAEAAERELIRRAISKQYGLVNVATSFKEFAEGTYTQYVEQNNVNVTAKKQYIRLLVGVFGSTGLASITPQDCRNCQAAMSKKGYAANSVNLIMSTLSKIFSLAREEGIIDSHPIENKVKRLKEPPPRDRLLTEDEKERLWKELEKDELLLRLVVLAVNLPLRRGQLLAITPTAISLPTGSLLIVASKGRDSRVVPLNNTALHTLSIMMSEGQIPFPLKETGVRKRWLKALKRAKIENFRFHDLRKEFASTLRRGGIHSKTIQDLFGHSSMRITDVYLPTEFAAMREAVNSLDVKEVEGIQ